MNYEFFLVWLVEIALYEYWVLVFLILLGGSFPDLMYLHALINTLLTTQRESFADFQVLFIQHSFVFCPMNSILLSQISQLRKADDSPFLLWVLFPVSWLEIFSRQQAGIFYVISSRVNLMPFLNLGQNQKPCNHLYLKSIDNV